MSIHQTQRTVEDVIWNSRYFL